MWRKRGSKGIKKRKHRRLSRGNLTLIWADKMDSFFAANWQRRGN